MASRRKSYNYYDLKVLLLMTVLITTLLINSVHVAAYSESQIPTSKLSSPFRKTKFQGRRMLIGSTAPNCTYNECRGCRFRCRAEQIPVDGNDPINSAYRYKCVCHR